MGVKAYYYQEDWTGGLADSAILGPAGSFQEGVGVDIHSVPGVITAHQKMKLDSGTTVTELCKFAVHGTDGNDYWFSSESGKVWRRTSAGTWSLLFTNANGACVGACEFDDYVWYATATKLGRYGPLSGSPSNTDSWSSGLTSSTYHPMCVRGVYLCIGNARTIATVAVSATEPTVNGIPDQTFAALPTFQKIRCLSAFGANLLIGTESTDTSSRAMLIQWDMASATFLSNPPDIPHKSIQAIISKGSYAYAICGDFGDIWYYNGSMATPFKKIPGTYSSSSYCSVNPGSVCDFQGRSMFGYSNGSGNPANEGIYGLGNRDKNYPTALTLDYPISTGEITGVTIGAMMSVGRNLFISWEHGTHHGIDIIDWDNKYASAYVQTMAIIGDRRTTKTFNNYVLSYASKPENTALALSYTKNYGTTYTSISLNEKTNDYKYWQKENIPTGVMQLRVDFTTSSNSAPQLDSLYTDWTEDRII